MYLTHNEGQSVVTYKNFEGQSLSKKMAANNIKSHLGYLNKLV